MRMGMSGLERRLDLAEVSMTVFSINPNLSY